jgi:hypothetical protein
VRYETRCTHVGNKKPHTTFKLVSRKVKGPLESRVHSWFVLGVQSCGVGLSRAIDDVAYDNSLAKATRLRLMTSFRPLSCNIYMHIPNISACNCL